MPLRPMVALPAGLGQLFFINYLKLRTQTLQGRDASPVRKAAAAPIKNARQAGR